jgi:hypothetical protein
VRQAPKNFPFSQSRILGTSNENLNSKVLRCCNSVCDKFIAYLNIDADVNAQRQAKHGVVIMKKFMLSTVAAMVLPTFASAADMPLKAPVALAPVSTWTGFYVGVNAGAALYESSVDYSGPQGWDTFFTSNPLQTSKVGGTVGGQFGYNYQIRSFVA